MGTRADKWIKKNIVWTLLGIKVQLQRRIWTQNYKENITQEAWVQDGKRLRKMWHRKKEQHGRKLRHSGKTETNEQALLLEDLYENENVKGKIRKTHASVRSWIFPQL